MRIHRLSIACLLLAGARAHADPPLFAPGLFGGSLRVDLQCADTFATPDSGLEVTIDGTPRQALQINGADAISYNKYGPVAEWVPTDIGFAVAPGRHRVAASAPGCSPETRDLDVPQLGPTFLEGRLAIEDGSLQGPVGAPDGIGLAFGVISTSQPATAGTSSLGSFASAYTTAAASLYGGMISASYEHRNLVVAWDSAMGGGSTTGIARETMAPPFEPPSPGAFAYNQTILTMSSTLRLGARLPLHQVALEVGSGIGGDLLLEMSTPSPGTAATLATLPNGTTADWFVPLWAAMTIKPTCDWGVQLMASYDLRPTDTGNSTLAVGAGLLWQPSRSCAEAPGVRVR